MSDAARPVSGEPGAGHGEPRLRLGFAGTPEFAAVILRGLLEGGQNVSLVLTQPDRPTGRGRKLTPSPVKELAREHGIEVRDPATLKGASLADANLDLLIVAAYGLILPGSVLKAPRLGCLNVHASLLPRWRGAAPVERAIMAGDRETGVCLMQMDEGLDTGPVYVCQAVRIGELETGSELEARLARLGAELLVATLPKLTRMNPAPQAKQGITYASKITAADSELDWQAGALATARRIRALSERQPVTLYAREGEEWIRIRLLGAATGSSDRSGAKPGTILSVGTAGLELACPDGSVIVQSVQLNRGKGRPMTPQAAANGYPALFAAGSRLLRRPHAAD